jgi:hypothetical protein
VLTKRIQWTGNRLQQAREDKNTQNIVVSGHLENREDHEKILLKHAYGNNPRQDNTVRKWDVGSWTGLGLLRIENDGGHL